jgi:hypothetical protein
MSLTTLILKIDERNYEGKGKEQSCDAKCSQQQVLRTLVVYGGCLT